MPHGETGVIISNAFIIFCIAMDFETVFGQFDPQGRQFKLPAG